MDEDQDQRQFFKDVGATAEQAVQEVRGVEENYFVLLQRMLTPFPWAACLNIKLQNYAEQSFVDALDFSRDLSRAKDIQDFVDIHGRFVQKMFKSVGEQAEDFLEACTESAGKVILDSPSNSSW
jgi:phasin protein